MSLLHASALWGRDDPEKACPIISSVWVATDSFDNRVDEVRVM
jgi:hypothetical protein